MATIKVKLGKAATEDISIEAAGPTGGAVTVGKTPVEVDGRHADVKAAIRDGRLVEVGETKADTKAQ